MYENRRPFLAVPFSLLASPSRLGNDLMMPCFGVSGNYDDTEHSQTGFLGKIQTIGIEITTKGGGGGITTQTLKLRFQNGGK